MRGVYHAICEADGGRNMRPAIILGWAMAFALAAGFAERAQGEDTVKIGFISTFSGPAGMLGRHMYDGFMLGVDHAGGRLGGLPTEIVKGDDQLKPDIGLQLSRQMIDQDKVNFVAGFVFSNVLIAASRPLFDARIFVISSTAGPAEFAGANCSPWFFSAAPENDMNDEGAGYYATKVGYKRVSLMAPNYVAGRDALNSFKRDYKGEVISETYTRLDEMDFATELAELRTTKPDALYVFLPGGIRHQFRQAV